MSAEWRKELALAQKHLKRAVLSLRAGILGK